MYIYMYIYIYNPYQVVELDDSVRSSGANERLARVEGDADRSLLVHAGGGTQKRKRGHVVCAGRALGRLQGGGGGGGGGGG